MYMINCIRNTKGEISGTGAVDKKGAAALWERGVSTPHTPCQGDGDEAGSDEGTATKRSITHNVYVTTSTKHNSF
jgi:hypothetical protein